MSCWCFIVNCIACFYVNDEPESKFLSIETIKLYCIVLYCIYILLSAVTDDNIQSHCWKWSISWLTSFQNISAGFVLEKSGGIGDVSWSDFPTMRGTDSNSVKSSSSSSVENVSMDLYHIKTMLSGFALQSLCIITATEFYYQSSHKKHPNHGPTHSPPSSCSCTPPTHTHHHPQTHTWSLLSLLLFLSNIP